MKEVKHIIETKSRVHRKGPGYTEFNKRVLQNKFFGQFPFWSSQNNLKKMVMLKYFVTRDKNSSKTPDTIAL